MNCHYCAKEIIGGDYIKENAYTFENGESVLSGFIYKHKSCEKGLYSDKICYICQKIIEYDDLKQDSKMINEYSWKCVYLHKNCN